MDEIEFETDLIKDKLEFLKALEEVIKNNATGYEILFKIENLKTKFTEKVSAFRKQNKISNFGEIIRYSSTSR